MHSRDLQSLPQPPSSARTMAIHFPAPQAVWGQLTGESHSTPEIPKKGLSLIRPGEKEYVDLLRQGGLPRWPERLMSPWLTRKRPELARTGTQFQLPFLRTGGSLSQRRRRPRAEARGAGGIVGCHLRRSAISSSPQP